MRHLLLAALLFGSATTASDAVQKTFVVRAVGDLSGIGLSTSEPIELSYTFDTDLPDISPSPAQGRYGPITVDFTIAGETLSFSGLDGLLYNRLEVVISDDFVSPPPFDGYGVAVAPQVPRAFLGTFLNQVSFNLDFGDDTSILDSDDLVVDPRPLYDAADSASLFILFQTSRVVISGKENVTLSGVPLPPAGFLLVGAFGALGLWRSRARSRRLSHA